MKKKAILKRLNALMLNIPSNTPNMTFITEDGDKFKVIEHYFARTNRYNEFFINSPDEYIDKGGIIFHEYGFEN